MDSGTRPLKMDGRKGHLNEQLTNFYSHTSPTFVPFPTETYPKNPLGPDELDPGMSLTLCVLRIDKFIWPDTNVVPFHYRKLNFINLG
jgi:hypothetical protein